MKRTYTDLHLCPVSRNQEQISRLANEASRLGYRRVALAFPPESPEIEIQRLRNICQETGIDLVSRVDLKPRAPSELVRQLRKLRRRFEIVAVLCESKNVSRQAAKDRRADLLNFPQLDFRRRFFDKAEAELASGGLASLEIDMKPLLILEGPGRIRLLSSLRREIRIAQDFHLPIILSSGVSDEFLMRRPRELAALASLFDLDHASAIDAVSKNPMTIVRRNREKLGPKFVAPGIRVIRKGKNCE
jgi:ribonuclease P/MRP protein subunit RPP1